ncbi:MAG: VOC family protein [Kofleriaceae bacterium]
MTMHRSRFSTVIIDCRTDDLPAAAAFWSAAFNRPIDRSNATYAALAMQPGEVLCQIQAVTHESRVHLDIETDDVDAEVARLTALGAREVERHESWAVMQAPTGQRFCVGRIKTADFTETANRWG